MGLIILAPLHFQKAPHHGLCPLSDSDATLGTEGRRPDGCHTPLCAEGAGPYGNTAAPPTGIYCHWQYLLSVPRSFADAQDDSGRRSPDPRSRSSIPAAPRLHAHHHPQRRSRCQTLEPSEREPRKASVPRAVKPHAEGVSLRTLSLFLPGCLSGRRALPWSFR